MSEFSFKKGFGSLIAKDQPEVKERIMKALGISNRQSWHNRLNGLIEPRVSEAQAIEKVFHDYGISEIWGV